MRGVVISPIKITDKNSFVVNGGIDPIKLNQYLLYWDKIDFPQNNLIGFGESPEIQYLKDIGILKQTNVQVHGSGEMTQLYVNAQLEALNVNNKVDKGRWTLAQEGIEMFLPKDDFVRKRNIEVELHNILPVPTEVSFDDILEFKEKRNDELLEFRSLMDSIYLEIINSGDSERAMTAYIDRLRRKIIEVDRVMNESTINRIYRGLKVKFDFSEIIKSIALGGIAGASLGHPKTGAAIGMASSFIKISSEISLRPNAIPHDLKDYAYLYFSANELK